MAAAILLVGHLGAQRRIDLHVVERRHRLRRIAERRVRGDVVDLFVADIDHAAVAQRFQMLFAAAQHGRYLRTVAKAPPYLCCKSPQTNLTSSLATRLAVECDARSTSERGHSLHRGECSLWAIACVHRQVCRGGNMNLDPTRL